MKSKKIEDRCVSLPDCFDELPDKLWLMLLRLHEKLINQQGVTLQDVRRKMADAMLADAGVKPSILSNKLDRYHLLVAQVADTLDWMIRFDDVTETVIVPIDTTKQLLPSYQGLNGPKSHAEDLCFGEFMAALAAMNEYTITHQPGSLLALTAILYRKPAGPDGKGRTPFHTEELPWLMNKAEHIGTDVRWGIYAWFAHLCEYIRSGEFRIMGSTVCFAPLFVRKPEESSGGDSLGMNGILMSVAESGVFGDADKVMQTPLLQVLLKLLKDYHTAERIKESIKTNQS